MLKTTLSAVGEIILGGAIGAFGAALLTVQMAALGSGSIPTGFLNFEGTVAFGFLFGLSVSSFRVLRRAK